MIRNLLLSIMLLKAAVAWTASQPIPCEVVVPLLDAHHAVVVAVAPDGKSYPVFLAAPASPLLAEVRQQLETSFAQQVLKLDRYARNLLIARRKSSGKAVEDALTTPMYLLMSNEEGGFARFGFWLQDTDGKRRLLMRAYVDLVVNERGVRTGGFEEIFSHELGHLILKALTGGLPAGFSRNMHQSMSITDYPTAFDEGYAEHFQAVVRDATTNPYLGKTTNGSSGTDFETLWLSAADGQLRIDGVKRNLFIHRKPLPSAALDPQPDLYRLFVDDETSTAFLPTELKNGQQMMASEGVIATLFYRLVNDDTLRNSYRDPSFYEPLTESPAPNPRQVITPYENVNLKLFAAMAQVPRWTADQPPILSILRMYGQLFPDEAKRVDQIFVETTWGAVTSQPLAAALQRASADGRRGDIAAFRQDLAAPLVTPVIAEVVDGRLALDANLGPELWVLNSNFKIASAYWETQRTEPLAINVNTGTVADFMTIPGVDLGLARKIVTERDARGFFRSLDALGTIGVPAAVLRDLREMQKQAQVAGTYDRP